MNPIQALSIHPLHTESPPSWLAPWIDSDFEYGLIEPVVAIGLSSDAVLDHAGGLAALVLGLVGAGTSWHVAVSTGPQLWDEIDIQQSTAAGLGTHIGRACRQREPLAVVGCRAMSTPATSFEQLRLCAELILLMPNGCTDAIIGGPDIMGNARQLGAATHTDVIEPPSTVRPATKGLYQARPRGLVVATVAGIAALVVFALVAGQGGDRRPIATTTSSIPQPTGPGLLLPDETRFPGGRVGASVSYDALTGAVTLFGGGRLAASSATDLFPRDTWTWDVTGWHRLQTTRAPPGVLDGAFAYDQRTGSAFLFGGINGQGHTWEWNGLAWRRLSPRTQPPPGAFASAVYDPERRSVVLTTVCCETAQARSNAPLQTWEWRNNDWSLLRGGNAPRLSRAPLITFDIARRELLLFTQGSTSVSDTTDQVTSTSALWAFYSDAWHRLSTPRSPPFDPLRDRFAYDPATRRVVLFQGGDLPTWTWDGSVWRQLSAGGPLYSGAMTANATVGRLLLFGGQVPADDLSSVWILQSSKWKRLAGR